MCRMEVFNPNVVRNFLSLLNQKNVNVTLQSISILRDPKYFAKPWKMSGMLVIVLLLARFGFGQKDASFLVFFFSNEKFEKCHSQV